MVISRPTKSNLTQSQEFVGKFSAPYSATDGYSPSGDFSVARGQADGYYAVTLPRKIPNANLIYADAKLVNPVYPHLNEIAKIVLQTPVDQTIEIVTQDADGYTTQVTESGAEIQFLLKFKGA